MKFHFQKLVRLAILLGCLLPGLATLAAVDMPPATLRNLAAYATRSESWPQLRRYAQSQSDQEWRGWAFFVAGYQEFQQKLYPQAVLDLVRAKETAFTLADYAAYYEALSLSQSSRASDAATLLEGFASRFPQSSLLEKALALRANCMLKANLPQKTIDLLVAKAEVHKQPALELLLGQAYQQQHQFPEAASAFQSVYYKFPLSSQADAAGKALKLLQTRMGASYPAPLDAWRIARAEALVRGVQYSQALDDYNGLLKDDSSNPGAPQWQLEKARCLWHLDRTTEALKEISDRFESAELEFQRLALLVHIHAQRSEDAAFAADLAALGSTPSPALADALSTVGMYYYRQLDWQNAARNYRRLWELFPQDKRLREDGWRLAWCDYLLKDPDTAGVMHKFLMQFPDSPRASSALYWLAQVEERKGEIAEARALYALLIQRFANNYYSHDAAARLANLRTQPATQTDHPNQGDAPLAASLIPVLPPPAVPAGIRCVSDMSNDAARPARILDDLGLPSLEQEVLKAAISGGNTSVELRMLLAGVYSLQGNAAGALFAFLRTVPGYSQMEFSDLPKEAWDFLYPRAYWGLIQKWAQANDLDPYLVLGLIRQESAFNPKALSKANARGLMQLLPQTAAHSRRASRVRWAGRRLYDPEYNVKVGCAYLAYLLKEFDGKPEYAVAAYNAGDSRIKGWTQQYTFRNRAEFLESIPIPATRVYVELVLRDAAVYRELLTGSPHFAECSSARMGAGQAEPATAGGEDDAKDLTHPE